MLIQFTLTKMKNLLLLCAIAFGTLSMNAQSEFNLDAATNSPVVQEILANYTCEDADINQDGAVTVMDLLEWTAAFNEYCDCRADINGNGLVDAMDKIILAGNYGAVCD